ncbi:hypothetical protein R1sor_005313 [Riccia sorocarpa]|uniref:Integrase catalytic domain-containing protein n=1 Tax=Riccia sorocarpa TaxID=122646 RepID=A0ABD3HMP1_9MARC
MTIAHTPQQNGISERKNRTLLERARSMALGNGIPNFLWAETVVTANYLVNRSPTRANSSVTPEEKFLGQPPDLSNLRAFGCLTYIHQGAHCRNKLEARSIKGVLVGYDENSKGYRCYVPGQKKIVITRDVKFCEDLTLKDAMTKSPEYRMEHFTDENAYHFPGDSAEGGESTPTSQLHPDSEDPPQTPADQDPESSTRDKDDTADVIPVDNHTGVTTEAVDDQTGVTTTSTEPNSDPATDEGSVPSTRRSTRTHKKPSHLQDYVSYSVEMEPTTFREASCQPQWVAAMNREMESIHKNGTWKLVSLPPDVKPITAKWVYKLKTSGPNSAPMFKARLVARGFEQQAGVDFEETYAPVVKWGTLRAVIGLAAQNGWTLQHLDVKTAFLNGDDTDNVTQLIRHLKNQFELTDLGIVTNYLRVRFMHLSSGIFMCQQDFLNSLLQEAGLQDCKSATTPMEEGLQLTADTGEESVDGYRYRRLVGKLLYIVNSRPDIAYAVGIVSHYMSNPQRPHQEAVKRILRYLQGTADYGILFKRKSNRVFTGYADADWGGDIDSRRSTSGYLFQLGGCPITWASKKQPTVSLSSTEAEYRALTEAAKEASWLRLLGRDLHLDIDNPTPLYCDNISSIKLANNPIFHGRSKHIDIHYHFIREQVLMGNIDLQHVSTYDQVADILTKPLGRQQFTLLRTELGVQSLSTANEGPAYTLQDTQALGIELIPEFRMPTGQPTKPLGVQHQQSFADNPGYLHGSSRVPTMPENDRQMYTKPYILVCNSIKQSEWSADVAKFHSPPNHQTGEAVNWRTTNQLQHHLNFQIDSAAANLLYLASIPHSGSPPVSHPDPHTVNTLVILEKLIQEVVPHDRRPNEGARSQIAECATHKEGMRARG